MPNRSIRRSLGGLVTCIVIATGATLAARGPALAQESPPDPGRIQPVRLSFELPAIGNVEKVKRWHFARIDNIQRLGTEEIALSVRTTDDRVHRLICPAGPFINLARTSRWMPVQGPDFPSRREFVERMVAFDADATGRIIALTSLEPVERRGRRIAEAFRQR